MQIYSIFDSKAECYLQPFFCPTRAVALRHFSQACNDETTQFYLYPGDFTLFELGDFNEKTGTLNAEKTHLNLGLAQQFKTNPAALKIATTPPAEKFSFTQEQIDAIYAKAAEKAETN